jgi:hypothetical protein
VTALKLFPALAALSATALLAACGSKSSPTAATSTTLSAPTPDSPADGAAATSYRPTFTVRNSTATAAGDRKYEFVVSDSSTFSSTTATTGAFIVSAHTTVAEGSGGSTSYTPDFDLQPATRLYWRSRLVAGGQASDWTTTRSITTPIAGYNRPGELYDPLIYGNTIGTPVGSTTFVTGQGVTLNDSNSYVRYQLAQTLTSGEFSMEAQGFHNNGPGAKLKVFSMSDGTGDLFQSAYLLNAQYRGVAGNPDNSISFKALYGDPLFKLEPDFGTRANSVQGLDPAKPYFWQGTWDNGFRLVILEGGIGGRPIYNVRITLDDIGLGSLTAGRTYNPTPHYAYLGANNGPYGEEDGSWPGITYRNVWVGRGPRPATLGNAIASTQGAHR